MQKTFQMDLAGKTLAVETGKYAQQAGGSCVVRCGGTAVLVCATASDTPRPGIDFFPLSVDFEEKLYSVGKIPGGFIKREGRPSTNAILTSRLIDRPIRPLFPKGWRNDVQVIATAMSVDTEIPPEVFGMIGSSIALAISDIPWAGPTGSVVVGMINGEYIINPTAKQSEESRMHLVVSGTRDAVMMVEAGASEVTEKEMLDGIMFGFEHIKKIVEFIDEIVAEIGKPKRQIEIRGIDPEIEAAVRAFAAEKVAWSLGTFERSVRDERTKKVREECKEHFAERFPEGLGDVEDVLYNMTKELVRKHIIEDGVRPDGRSSTQIRDIWCEAGGQRTHGSRRVHRGQPRS